MTVAGHRGRLPASASRDWRREYALPIALALVALFGGVPAAVIAATDDQPTYASCAVFSRAIQDQVADGLPARDFRRWDEPAIEEDCGQAHEIAQDWVEARAEAGAEPEVGAEPETESEVQPEGEGADSAPGSG